MHSWQPANYASGGPLAFWPSSSWRPASYAAQAAIKLYLSSGPLAAHHQIDSDISAEKKTKN
jgi:hypothetical protein